MGAQLSGLSDADIISKATAVTLSVNNNKQEVNNNNEPKGHVVILPVDGRAESERTFNWYLTHLHRPENMVHLVHCCEIEPPNYKDCPDYIVPPEAVNEILDGAKTSGKRVLDKFKSQLKVKNLEGDVHLELGRPGPMLVKALAKCKATLVVAGCGANGLDTLGSTARYLFLKSPVPVALIPPPKEE